MRNVTRRGRFAAASTGFAVAAAVVVLSAGAAPSPQTKLTASDGAAGRELGASVAVFGDTAIVSAPDVGGGAGPKRGSAYVFTRTGSAWSQRKKLTADDGEDGDFFGSSAAIQGDTVVVGALGIAGSAGAAYVFKGSGAAWKQQQKLVADDATPFSWLGRSVAIDGDTVIAGATATANFRGAVYVFTRTGTVWTQQAKLTASDGADFDEFGFSVAISGDTVLVGSPGRDDGPTSDTGGAYVFTRSGTVWTERKILVPDDGGADDAFGVSVALSGTTALVGSQLHDVGLNGNQGAAYVFTGSGDTWTQQPKLLRTSGTANDNFGVAVALEGDTALVGALFAKPVLPATTPGTAVVFKRTDGVWTQSSELTSDETVSGDQFGAAVALSNGTAIVGAVGQANLEGAAYPFAGLPASPLLVTTKKGSMTDSAKPGKDAVSARCQVEFRADSDGAFDPATESLRVSIGNAAEPFVLQIAAGDPAVKSKLNFSKHTATYMWKSAKGAHPKASFKLFVPATGPATLTASASSLDLPPAADVGLIRVSVVLGADDGGDTDAWRTKGPKRLFP